MNLFGLALVYAPTFDLVFAALAGVTIAGAIVGAVSIVILEGLR
jgi:hypothetical protein